MDNGKKTILVVDDEQEFSKSIQIRLISGGFNVISASDGREAIASALKNKPDLILLDIHMPNGDGHSVVSRLKSSHDEHASSTPVIYMTASRDKRDINKACVNESIG